MMVDVQKLIAAARRLLLASNAGREAIQRVIGPALAPSESFASDAAEMRIAARWKKEEAVFAERKAAADELARELAAVESVAEISESLRAANDAIADLARAAVALGGCEQLASAAKMIGDRAGIELDAEVIKLLRSSPSDPLAELDRTVKR